MKRWLLTWRGIVIALVIAAVASGGRAAAESFRPTTGEDAIPNQSSFPPGTTWNTPFVIQNVGTGPAVIQVSYYDNNGAVIRSISQGDVPVGGNFTVRPQNDNVLLPGSYSVVVSADQPVASIVNVVSSGRGMAYTNPTSGAKVFFPNYNKDYGSELWNTPIYIQNANTNANVTLTVIFRNDQQTVVKTLSNIALTPGQSWTGDPTNISDLASGKYSVEVQASGGSIVGTQFQISAAQDGLEMAVNGFTEGGPTVYLPNVNREYATQKWNSPFLIQNMGSQSTTVRVQYYSGNQLVKEYSDYGTLAPGGTATERPHRRSVGELPPGIYAVKILSDNNQPIVATVNQVSLSSPVGGGSLAYGGFTTGWTRISLPNINKLYGGESWITPVVAQNIGGQATGAVIEYYNDAGQLVKSYDLGQIAPGSNVAERPHNRADLPDGKYSAIVRSYNPAQTSQPGQQLVAIVNQVSFNGATMAALSYEGLPAQ